MKPDSSGKTGSSDKFHFLLASTAYRMDMKNWISWGQRPDGKWTVYNQDSASVKGLESRLKMTTAAKVWNLGVQVLHTWQKATDPKTDNYLQYVPKHKLSSTFIAGIGSFKFMYAHSYTGKRYTNATNSSELASYDVGKSLGGKSIPGPQNG